MNGWNRILFFWDGLFSGVVLVSGSVVSTKFDNTDEKIKIDG